MTPPPLAPQPANYAGASLAFDGQYLDYTEDATDSNGKPIVQTYNTVYWISPDCTKNGTYVIPSSLTGGSSVPLYQVTYDPLYRFANGDLGAVLARTGNGTQNNVNIANFGQLEAAVFAIDPANPSADEVAFSIPCGSGGTNCQSEPSLFVYDPYRDRIWISIPDDNGFFHPTLIAVPSAKAVKAIIDPHQTCMNGYTAGLQSHPQDYATWAVGGSDVLFVQLEDDTTVVRVDSNNCQAIGNAFQHAQYQEAGSDENDQMVCDPVTNGSGPNGTSLLWLRNVGQHNIQPYQIPGACPLPTALNLQQPLIASAGQPVTACATLTKVGAGRPPIAGEPLAFRMNSQVLGSVVTNGSGNACLTFIAPNAGGSYPVGVHFNGTGSLNAADARGVLLVPAAPAAAKPPAPPPITNPVPQPGQPPPAPAPNAVVQTQIQVGAQAQPQLQAGMTMEEGQQMQLTIAGLGDKKQGLLAARRDPQPLFVMLIQLIAAATGGAILLWFTRAGKRGDPQRWIVPAYRYRGR